MTAMSPEQMKARTKALAIRAIRLVASLPRNPASDVIGRQLLKSGTSVGANYRAACRSRTDRDFLARMGTVEEETDESLYWMEVLIDADLMPRERLTDLMVETEEILRIVVASIKTARKRLQKPRCPKLVSAPDAGRSFPRSGRTK